MCGYKVWVLKSKASGLLALRVVTGREPLTSRAKMAHRRGSRTHKMCELLNKMTNLASSSSFSENCRRPRCPPPQSWKKPNIKSRLCKQVCYSACRSSCYRPGWPRAGLRHLPVPPGPLWHLSPPPPWWAWRREGAFAPACLRPPPPQLPTSTAWVTHTESLRWEALNPICITATSHPFFLLFFQQTSLNHQTVKGWHLIWNNNEGKKNPYFYPVKLRRTVTADL